MNGSMKILLGLRLNQKFSQAISSFLALKIYNRTSVVSFVSQFDLILIVVEFGLILIFSFVIFEIYNVIILLLLCDNVVYQSL